MYGCICGITCSGMNDYLVLKKSKLYHHRLHGGLFYMAIGSQDEEPSYLNLFELEDEGYPCCLQGGL